MAISDLDVTMLWDGGASHNHTFSVGDASASFTLLGDWSSRFSIKNTLLRF